MIFGCKDVAGKHEILSEAPLPNLISLFRMIPDVYFTSQPPSETFWRALLTDTASAERKAKHVKKQIRLQSIIFVSRLYECNLPFSSTLF